MNNVPLSNLPLKPKPANAGVDSTRQTFNDYYQFPLQINLETFNVMRGFFEQKGFDKLAAESIAVTLIRQCLNDNINPLTTLDGLAHLDGADLSNLVTQILNYNRFKSSYLGIGTPVTPNQHIQKNILP
jgi:ABC-type uncharacterized transport system involved in gliding motility auxiliary subunit